MTAFYVGKGPGAERLVSGLARIDGDTFNVIQLIDGTYLVPSGRYRLVKDLGSGIKSIDSVDDTTRVKLAPNSRVEMTEFLRRQQTSPNQVVLIMRKDSLGIPISYKVPVKYPRQRTEWVVIKNVPPAPNTWKDKGNGTVRW